LRFWPAWCSRVSKSASRIAQRQRGRDALLQLIQSFRTPEFAEGITVISDLPDGLSKLDLEKQVGDKILCVRALLFSLESVGSLVRKREIPIVLVEDFFKGPVILTWRKTAQYTQDLRADLKMDTVYEYVQWMAERLLERGKTKPRVPAYVAYRDWKE
jgi:hypothetical protein